MSGSGGGLPPRKGGGQGKKSKGLVSILTGEKTGGTVPAAPPPTPEMSTQEKETQDPFPRSTMTRRSPVRTTDEKIEAAAGFLAARPVGALPLLETTTRGIASDGGEGAGDLDSWEGDGGFSVTPASVSSSVGDQFFSPLSISMELEPDASQLGKKANSVRPPGRGNKPLVKVSERYRVHSLERMVKRRRADFESEGETDEDQTVSGTGTEIDERLKTLRDEISSLNLLIAGSQNTKTEIKHSVAKLMGMVKKVEQAVGITIRESKRVEETLRQNMENIMLKSDSAGEMISVRLTQKLSEEGLVDLVGKSWPRTTFKSIRVKKETPGMDESDLITVVDVQEAKKGKGGETSRISPFLIDAIKSGNVKPGCVVTAELALPCEDSVQNVEKVTVRTIVVDTEDMTKCTKDMITGLNRIKESRGDSLLGCALEIAEGVAGERVIKLMEYMGRQAGGSFTVYKKQVPSSGGQAADPGFKNDSIVVSAKNKTFAEICQEFKSRVKQDGTEITAMRKTHNGALEVRVKEAISSAGSFRKTVLSQVKGSKEFSTSIDLRVTGRIPQKSFVIKDLEDDVTKEIIKKGIANAGNCGEKETTVIHIRRAYGGTKIAVVRTDMALAKRLLKTGRVRIGWVSCRIQEIREDLEKCFRCWAYGHTARNCTGPDRGKACFNCGETGHFASECTASSKCLVCGEVGHTTTSGICQKGEKQTDGKGEESPHVGKELKRTDEQEELSHNTF